MVAYGSRNDRLKWRVALPWALGIGCAFGVAVALIVRGQITEFIYFNF